MNSNCEQLDGVRAGPRGLPDIATYRNLKLVVFDVDGVLTDGRIVYDVQGVESKFFDVRDGAGIALLRMANILTGILTGRTSPVVELRARELKIPSERVKQGALQKRPVFEQMLREAGVSFAESAYVGDDLIDMPVLEKTGIACCVADAHSEVIQRSHIISQNAGGRGGVRQICEHLLKYRADGVWETALEKYLTR